ncbi:MAG: protoporphyrinogen oxidase, partial [Planctomycetaceae bacterium]|nr:protoporphyrinogen oxidase [Planctomycetaceae bacterium]
AGSQAGGFDALILAVPAYRAASLLAQEDEPLANDLRKIPYASSAVIVTGHRLEDVAHPLNAFGLVVPTIERSDVLAVSFASRKFPNRAPEGRVLLRTFVGGAMRPEMLKKSDEELIALARTELASLLGVSGSPDVAIVSRYENAMPQYHLGHLDLVRRIEAATSKHVGLELTGSAYRGVGIPDVVADADRAAEAVFSQLMQN